MKKWLIWAAAALLASCGHKANYSGKDTYVIQGESSAFVDGQYMFVADATNWSYLDSAKIEGHAFYLESRNTGTGIAMLYMGENSASRSLQQISNYFFPETGYALVCDGLFVEGSPWNETYNRLLKLHRKDPEAWKAQTTELVKTNLNVLGCHYLDELRGVLAWDELKELTARFAPEMGNHPLFLYVKDKIEHVPEFFLKTWVRSLRMSLSSNAWATVSLVVLGVMLACVLLYLLATKLALRKTGFYSAIILLLLFIFSVVSASIGRRELTHAEEAIVMSSAAPVKSSPDNGSKDLFVLHEGTKVRVLNALEEWREISIADGNKGWIKESAIELIQ